MSWLKRMFDSRYRRARAAEGAGQWRTAAALWAEAGEPLLAAEALVHLAERGGSFEERVEALHDALRWIPESEVERRDEVETKLAMTVLEDARLRGVASAEEKRRLADAAARLERLELHADAADAYELLGRTEDVARCLEAAGEIERLEALLERTSQKDEREGELRRLLSEYEMALKYGARLEARAALRKACELAPNERSVAELLRRLEARMPPPSRVRLAVDGRRVTFVGRLPAVLGRGEVDVPIRGTSVSRRHAEIALANGTLVIRDLDSRNGTLVRGLPIRGALELSGPSEIGLGDDVTLAVEPQGRALVIEVLRGFDRGERIVVGEGDLRVDGMRACVRFVEGWASIVADPRVELVLEGQSCALPVHVLTGDRLVVGGVPVEVLE
ncbi:MAG TPA: FHA domain-containing protein [Sandaracinaceae bacterium]